MLWSSQWPCRVVRADRKEGGAPKNQCLRAVVLEKTPERLLDSKEIKPVNLKGNQSWVLIGRTDAETPVFWLSDVNSWLIGNISDAGKDWGQKEKRMSEDEMAKWHHRCNGHELRQTLWDGEGQGSLGCCSPWGCKELDKTGRWTTTTTISLVNIHLYKACVSNRSLMISSPLSGFSRQLEDLVLGVIRGQFPKILMGLGHSNSFAILLLGWGLKWLLKTCMHLN